ncbi:unnamed protein product [Cuscuta campestris]|uniref:Uncharacterized protein n=1 Tax=Cuscuta campestris TaxID=132261 RepID=A0A484NFZ7_9ASTE|nr:unnamed protein product [Cuscuta campestris]
MHFVSHGHVTVFDRKINIDESINKWRTSKDALSQPIFTKPSKTTEVLHNHRCIMHVSSDESSPCTLC